MVAITGTAALLAGIAAMEGGDELLGSFFEPELEAGAKAVEDPESEEGKEFREAMGKAGALGAGGGVFGKRGLEKINRLKLNAKEGIVDDPLTKTRKAKRLGRADIDADFRHITDEPPELPDAAKKGTVEGKGKSSRKGFDTVDDFKEGAKRGTVEGTGKSGRRGFDAIDDIDFKKGGKAARDATEIAAISGKEAAEDTVQKLISGGPRKSAAEIRGAVNEKDLAEKLNEFTKRSKFGKEGGGFFAKAGHLAKKAIPKSKVGKAALLGGGTLASFLAWNQTQPPRQKLKLDKLPTYSPKKRNKEVSDVMKNYLDFVKRKDEAMGEMEAISEE